MRDCARLLALVAVAVAAMCQGALAQTAAEAASKWSLLGTWRLDCSKAPSRADGGLTYAVRGGRLFHDREFGDARDASLIPSATIKSNGWIEIVLNLASLKMTRQYTLMKGRDGRIRAMSNRNIATDEYTIRDGKFTANGKDTPWQTRCR